MNLKRHLNAIFIYFSGQMFLLDRFFDGTFFTYGIEVMSFADRDQVRFNKNSIKFNKIQSNSIKGQNT